MKKNNKIRRLLSSFVCLIGSTIGFISGLSSCVLSSNEDENDSNSDDSVVTPPSNDDNNTGDNNSDSEIPSQPETKPEAKPPTDNTPNEPNLPENKPEPIPPSSNLISNNSINLKDKGQLLPSQYLTNISNLNNIDINKEKIVENFDKNKVIDSKYSLISLNDENGILSIKMEYKDTSNRTNEFVFNFSNLANLKNQNFSLSFNVENKSLLNAKEISDKKIINDSQAKVFLKYLEQNKTNLIFKNGLEELPLEYLNFAGGIDFSGFQSSWYTSNKELKLNIQPKSLKINAYEKDANSSNISIKNINYPSNLIGSNKKPIELTCSSSLDYLLEQIITNDEYIEDKFASYYYYDMTENGGMVSQLKLTNKMWLKNVSNNISGYYDKQYKPVLSKTNNPSIDESGNLIIQIQIQLSDDDIFSINSKTLIIKSFLRTDNNLFYYDGNKQNKFNLFCDGSKQDEMFDHIKKNKNIVNIKNKINGSHDEIVDLSKYFNSIDHNKFKNNIKLYFGDSEVVKNNSANYFASEDDKISIKHYLISYYDTNNVIIQYDKVNQCFQTKCKLTIQCEGIEYDSSTSDEMIVNITKINKPLT